MTIVAYRDGVMAADSAITAGGRRCGNVRKMAKAVDGTVIGCCGSWGLAATLLAQVEEGKALGDLRAKEDGAYAIIVTPGHDVWLLDDKHPAYRIVDDGNNFHAIGSGSDIAVGAMEMGATAAQAVAAAILHSTTCGGSIVVEEVAPVRGRKSRKKR